MAEYAGIVQEPRQFSSYKLRPLPRIDAGGRGNQRARPILCHLVIYTVSCEARAESVRYTPRNMLDVRSDSDDFLFQLIDLR